MKREEGAFTFLLFLFVIFSAVADDTATRNDVKEIMQKLKDGNPQSLTNLWLITDTAVAAVGVWNPVAGVVALTARNYMKNKYDPDSEEVKAIKLLGNLSLATFTSLRKEIQSANSATDYLIISSEYDNIVSYHLDPLHDLVKFVTEGTITYARYSRICKWQHDPFEIINKLYVIMVSNCNMTESIKNKTDKTSESYDLIIEFFNWLENEIAGIKTLFYEDDKNRITMKLSHKSIDEVEVILKKLRNEIKDKPIGIAWDLIAETSSQYTDFSIGLCLPNQIAKIAKYNFYLISASYAKIIKNIIDVSIPAIYCLDEIAEGDPIDRDNIMKQAKFKLESILNVSNTYMRKVLSQFISYDTLVSSLRQYLDTLYEFPVPVAKYNDTAIKIRTFLEARGFNEIFFQVIITENEIYGRDLEFFSSNNETKPSYMIWNYKTTHIFVNRYNISDGKNYERARNAFNYIEFHRTNITKVISDYYDEVLVANLYLQIQAVVPDLISDHHYTGLLILSEWDMPWSTFIQWGNATNYVDGTNYYDVISTVTSSFPKTFYHRLIFLL